MNPLQNTKFLNSVPPEAIHADTTGFGFTEIDTLGYDYLTIIITLGATDIGLTALALTEGDTSGSGHANITGTVYGTATDIAGTTSVLPALGDGDEVFVYELDLKTRKRYIDATITPGDGSTGMFLSAVSILSRAGEAPTTAAARGCNQILRV